MAFTFFFRDREVLDLVVEYALPELKTHMYINVWDAGCAMGPEAFSLAIHFRENMGRFLFRNVRIFATDIDEQDQFGPVIASGIYEEKDVKRIPPDLLNRYFILIGDGRHFKINDEIIKSVKFQKHDLLSLKAIREGFGLIVCKNVLLHFSPAERAKVIHMFHQALADGGYFVTEHTQKMPEECAGLFKQVTPAGQLYQKV